MTENNLREAEKSPLIMSYNKKEERLLEKKLLSLDSMKKQTADSLIHDQKILYNQFTLKLRRSELAHAKLLGNRDLVKQLTHAMFSSLNTTVSDGSGEAVTAIVQTGKSPRIVSAPCRPTSRVPDKRSYQADQNNGFGIYESKGMNVSCRKPYPSQRFYSAPGRRQSGNGQTQVAFVEAGDPKNKYPVAPVRPLSQTSQHECLATEFSGTGIMKLKMFSKAETGPRINSAKWPQGSANADRPRPKSTSFWSDNVIDKTVADIEDAVDRKVKSFMNKVKSMQHLDCTMQDYYSQRMLDGKGKKHTVTLMSEEEEESRKWLPVGKESQHRSITIKELDRNFTGKEVPADILLMDQYNMILTKENYIVRHWINNNPYMITE